MGGGRGKPSGPSRPATRSEVPDFQVPTDAANRRLTRTRRLSFAATHADWPGHPPVNLKAQQSPRAAPQRHPPRPRAGPGEGLGQCALKLAGRAAAARARPPAGSGRAHGLANPAFPRRRGRPGGGPAATVSDAPRRPSKTRMCGLARKGRRRRPAHRHRLRLGLKWGPVRVRPKSHRLGFTGVRAGPLPPAPNAARARGP
jgi:hypothetical protein